MIERAITNYRFLEKLPPRESTPAADENKARFPSWWKAADGSESRPQFARSSSCGPAVQSKCNLNQCEAP